MARKVRSFVRGEAGKDHPYILFGDVAGDGSCCGEAVASFDWEQSGGYEICSLQVYSDGFAAFRDYADVFAALGDLEACSLVWSVDEAAAFLVSLGFSEVG